MENLTSQQVRDLANNFLDIAQAVGNFRYKNYDRLNDRENKLLTDLHKTILGFADNLFTLSAVVVMADVRTSLEAIEGVTTRMQQTYKQLENIQKGIDIAAKVVTLGASVLSQNPAAVASSIQGLVDAVAG